MTGHPRFTGLAIACIDGRLWKTHEDNIDRFIEKKFGGQLADVIMTAGATARLLTSSVKADMFEDIGLSYTAHGVRRLVIFEHENCGKYAELAGNGDDRFAVTEEDEQTVHDRNSQETATLLLEHYPELEIERYYVKLDGTIVPLD